MTHKKPPATIGRKRKAGNKAQEVRCSVPECGRPAYARGLCQTHHRQKLTTGKVKPIHPYRKRSEGTVKFAGLRLTSFCAERIREYADERGLSIGAAIAEVLHGWLVTDKRPAP